MFFHKVTGLATIGAGLAGSFGSDGNFASGVAAAETGKNAVENNELSPTEQKDYNEAKEYLEQNCSNGEQTLDCQTKDNYVNTYLAPRKDSVSQDYYEPGQVVDCVSSGSGKYIVTNETTIIKNAINGDYTEWKIKPLNTEQEAIKAQSNYNYNFVVNAKNGGCSLSPILCALLVIPNKNDLLTGEEYTVGDKVLAAIGVVGLLTGGALVKEKAPGKRNTGNKNPTSAITDNAGTGSGTSGSLTGSQTKLPPNATPENIRSLVRENESAQILSKSGYHVEQNPTTFGVKNPDYKINGEIFDNYAPSSNNIRNIWREVDKKHKMVRQIVLSLI